MSLRKYNTRKARKEKMLEKLKNKLSNDIGIDLGTANTLEIGRAHV